MVNAKWVSAWNMSIACLWGKSPKITVICGKCNYSFSGRVPVIRGNSAKLLCPACNEINDTGLYCG